MYMFLELSNSYPLWVVAAALTASALALPFGPRLSLLATSRTMPFRAQTCRSILGRETSNQQFY
jgi:hypothetical protein